MRGPWGPMGPHGDPMGTPWNPDGASMGRMGTPWGPHIQCRIVHKIAEQDSETLETLKWTGFLFKMQR